MNNIDKLLKKLNIKDTGVYKNHFYTITLNNSDHYAKMYSLLDKYAVNTEYPEFTKNTNGTTTNVANYFETEIDDIKYQIFLFADFNKDEYKLKITEQTY